MSSKKKDGSLCYKNSQCKDRCIQNICTNEQDDRYEQYKLKINTNNMDKNIAINLLNTKSNLELELYKDNKFFIPKGSSFCSICQEPVLSWEPRIICRMLHVHHVDCILDWETGNRDHRTNPEKATKIKERSGTCPMCNPQPLRKIGDWTPEEIEERKKIKYFRFDDKSEEEEFMEIIKNDKKQEMKDGKHAWSNIRNYATNLYYKEDYPKSTVWDWIGKKSEPVKTHEEEEKIEKYYMSDFLKNRSSIISKIQDLLDSGPENKDKANELLNETYNFYKSKIPKLKYSIHKDANGRYDLTIYKELSDITYEQQSFRQIEVENETDGKKHNLIPFPSLPKKVKTKLIITIEGEFMTFPKKTGMFAERSDISKYTDLIFNNNFIYEGHMKEKVDSIMNQIENNPSSNFIFVIDQGERSRNVEGKYYIITDAETLERVGYFDRINNCFVKRDTIDEYKRHIEKKGSMDAADDTILIQNSNISSDGKDLTTERIDFIYKLFQQKNDNSHDVKKSDMKKLGGKHKKLKTKKISKTKRRKNIKKRKSRKNNKSYKNRL